MLGKNVAPDGVDGRGVASVCIVNRMDTGLDERARIRSYGEADVFFKHLAHELGIEIGAPTQCKHLHSAMDMKKLAMAYLPPSSGHYVGSAEKERRMAAALAKVETDMIFAQNGAEFVLFF